MFERFGSINPGCTLQRNPWCIRSFPQKAPGCALIKQVSGVTGHFGH
jgi:hypothetical protein